MLGKKCKEQDQKPSKASAPTVAGAPKVHVRKTWEVGNYRVVSEGVYITIRDNSTASILSPMLTIRRDEAAGIADAILQAS